MKRILSFLLIVLIVIALIACDKPCTEHNDADGDGVCDTPGCYEGLKPDGTGNLGGVGGLGGGGAETPKVPLVPEY